MLTRWSSWILIIVLTNLACATKNTQGLTLTKSNVGVSNKAESRGVSIWQDSNQKRSSRLQPSLWVLSIGISQYKNASLNLDYADADASAITTILKKQEGKLFDKVETLLLTNDRATRSSVLGAFSFLNRAAPDDTAFIFVAGHGVQDKATDSYYFLPYGADQNNLISEGLLWASFDEGIKKLRSNVNKVILVIDTCHAGAMRVAGARSSATDGANLAAKLRSAEGLFILAASKSGENSLEDKQCKHGVFTCAMLNAFDEGDYNHDGVLMASELVGYVSREVPNKTEGRQHPYQKTIEGTDIPIAIVEKDGLVTINAIPWGYIKIDGELIDRSPIVNYSLPSGKHDLEVEKPGHAPLKRTIRVEGGTINKYSVTLTPQ
jgi:hypothetical protein